MVINYVINSCEGKKRLAIQVDTIHLKPEGATLSITKWWNLGGAHRVFFLLVRPTLSETSKQLQ